MKTASPKIVSGYRPRSPTKNSFLSAVAGWFAGAISFGVVAASHSGGPAAGWALVGALYGAPFILFVWLTCLWPLYKFVPAHSFAWRPLVCVPAGAVAGGLLYFGVIGSGWDWEVRPYFDSLSVAVGASVGAVTCAAGCALKRREERVL